MNTTASLLRLAVLPVLLLGVACTSSVETEDPDATGAGGSTASSTSNSTSAASTGSTGTSSTSTTSGTGGGSVGCDLAEQDCGDGESCYPTADGAECAPTGDGAPWTQCEENAACQEGLFCNPYNYMHCVPYCEIGADDCGEGEVCYESDGIEMPQGWGWCGIEG